MKKLLLFFFIGFSCLAQNEQSFVEYSLRPELFFGKTIAAFDCTQIPILNLLLG